MHIVICIGLLIIMELSVNNASDILRFIWGFLIGYISYIFCHWNYNPKNYEEQEEEKEYPLIDITRDEANQLKKFLLSEGYSESEIKREFSSYNIRE